MSNLAVYEAVRAVPNEAQKTITGGRLNGKTDINPMWRIKALTEQFGPCGIGWKYEIVRQWTEQGGDKGQIAAFCNINLFYKYNGEWSDGIPGTGGSMFVESERGGLYVSDECFKMALTDAISVSAKALGIGADIYWSADKSKYDKLPESHPKPEVPAAKIGELYGLAKSKGFTADTVKTQSVKKYKVMPEVLTREQYDKLYTGYLALPDAPKDQVS